MSEYKPNFEKIDIPKISWGIFLSTLILLGGCKDQKDIDSFKSIHLANEENDYKLIEQQLLDKYSVIIGKIREDERGVVLFNPMLEYHAKSFPEFKKAVNQCYVAIDILRLSDKIKAGCVYSGDIPKELIQTFPQFPAIDRREVKFIE
jgi:hypothetical protein